MIWNGGDLAVLWWWFHGVTLINWVGAAIEQYTFWRRLSACSSIEDRHISSPSFHFPSTPFSPTTSAQAFSTFFPKNFQTSTSLYGSFNLKVSGG